MTEQEKSFYFEGGICEGAFDTKRQFILVPQCKAAKICWFVYIIDGA